MWIQHAFSLLGSVLHIFFVHIGATWLGLALALAYTSSVAIDVLLEKRKSEGWKAMLNHWRKEHEGPVKFAILAAVLIYGPALLWSLGQAVYEDHQGLVGRVHELHGDIHQDGINLQQVKDICAAQLLELRVSNGTMNGENKQLENQNGTQNDTINNCQNQALQLLKPPYPRVITHGTLLYSLVPDPIKPSDMTVILVGSVTAEYQSFKGSIECASPFEAKQISLSQGLIGANALITSGFAKSVPISFYGANWKVGETLVAVIHGDGLNPNSCQIKS